MSGCRGVPLRRRVRRQERSVAARTRLPLAVAHVPPRCAAGAHLDHPTRLTRIRSIRRCRHGHSPPPGRGTSPVDIDRLESLALQEPGGRATVRRPCTRRKAVHPGRSGPSAPKPRPSEHAVRPERAPSPAPCGTLPFHARRSQLSPNTGRLSTVSTASSTTWPRRSGGAERVVCNHDDSALWIIWELGDTRLTASRFISAKCLVDLSFPLIRLGIRMTRGAIGYRCNG